MDPSSKRCDEEARKKVSAEPKCGFSAIYKELSKGFFFIYILYLHHYPTYQMFMVLGTTSIRALGDLN